MHYFGGKCRIAKQLSAYLESKRKGRVYVEPFVGGAWVAARISQGTGRMLYDANQPLITMYQALQNGWEPPDTVSEAEYAAAKAGNCTPELQAFIGFGCSFAGKWFGGYARDSLDRNYAAIAKRSLRKKLPTLFTANFACADYRTLTPVECLVYCDPPYKGTTQYGAVGNFDSDKFWDTVREWSLSNTVLVSEYSAPNDFDCVWEVETKTSIRCADGNVSKRTEKLFEYDSTPTLFSENK
jgi:DNA adenine methylase